MDAWPLRTLSELCATITVGHVSAMAGEYLPSGIPFLRSKNVRPGRLDLTDLAYVGIDFHQRIRKSQLFANDIAIVRTGTPGAAALIPDGFGEANCSDIIIARPTEQVSPRFLCYAINATAGAFVSAHTVGAVQQHFNIGSARKLQIHTPPLHEQQAVAEVLGTLDDKIASNERQLITLNELCSAWHERIINRGYAETSTYTLAELAKRGFMALGDGYRTKQSEHGEPGLPILRVADVGHGTITPSFTHYVSDAYRDAMGPKVSQLGDVILTTKGTVGRVALIDSGQPEFVYSPQVCYFRLAESSPVSPLYMLHWFQGKEFWSQAGGLKGQTDMADYLSLRDIRALRITVPSPADLSEFSRVCNPMQEQSEAARRENDTLTALRDTLLPQLITGKIRVKDAERIVEDAA
ncbi:restriction endonuclease subunit S [Streptomyces sp. NPDC059096]|uniref:restriction endonuclease subunit S n=1 Tax=Streptomyces sp. NPDC059096 TaxID=3346727 RepID=UPI0036B5F141